MSDTPVEIPNDATLEAFALNREAQGDVRGVICFVEAWRHLRAPTVPSLLAQARALLTIGLVDHAWLRIQYALEQPDYGLEADVMAIEACIARGWTNAAKGLLTHALHRRPRASALRQLQERLNTPAPVVPLETNSTSIDTQLEDIRRKITLGESHSALGYLQQLKASEMTQAQQEQANDLLWGQTTDTFMVQSLEQWVEEHQDTFHAYARQERLQDASSSLSPVDAARPADWSKTDTSPNASMPSIRSNEALLRLLPSLEKEDEARVQLVADEEHALEPDPTTEVHEVSLDLAMERSMGSLEIMSADASGDEEMVVPGTKATENKPLRWAVPALAFVVGGIVLLFIGFAWLRPMLSVP